MKRLLMIVVLLGLIMPMDGGNTIAKANGSCWKVIASELNIRSGPDITYSEVGDYYYGDIVEGASNGAGWVQTSAGWISQNWLNPCGSNTSSPQSNGVIENFDGFTVVNRPYWMDSGRLQTLFYLVRQYTNNPQGITCPNSAVVIYFGTASEGNTIAGRSVPGMLGITGNYLWDGSHLSQVYGYDCGSLVRGVFILKGMDQLTTWDTMGHEISHVFGAIHGASSPSNVRERNPEWTTYGDAYWMGYEVRKAYSGNCGANPSEFCYQVNLQVFQ